MRLIDADALGVTDFELVFCDGDYKELCKTLIAKVESAPTVDAVPVVRCRECRYAHLTYDGEAKYCDAWAELYEVNERVYLSGDFYCAHGQRREDGDA